jgi:hypothetical protein
MVISHFLLCFRVGLAAGGLGAIRGEQAGRAAAVQNET